MMLATPSSGAGNRAAIDLSTLVDSGKWALDTKLDGVRAMVEVTDPAWPEAEVRITNRNGVLVTSRYPDVVAQIESAFTVPITLDGEIVAQSGKFHDVAVRDKHAHPGALVQQIPCRFIAFDILSLDGGSLMGQPWTERRHVLDTLLPADMTTPWSVDMAFFEAIRDHGMEGVIAKRLDSLYHPNTRSRDWIKFKCLHRVSCVAVGYSPGEGARAHFGAMDLALIGPDAGEVYRVGRVGTGFTRADIDELKARLDAGEFFVVEIECLNVTTGGQLRFPSFKGIRSDVSVPDCTFDQLATIPVA